jgi:hexosaminidase
MKKIFLLYSFCFFVFHAFCQSEKASISIIPQPVSLVQYPGEYTLPAVIKVESESGSDLDKVIKNLEAHLSFPTGKKVISVKKDPLATIFLKINTRFDSTLGAEGYTLKVSKLGISIHANKAAGLFYGAQTLYQLLPPEIESSDLVKKISWKIPYVEIRDYPRFSWRGLMFDVSRHFFTTDEVRAYIHQMARYKFNLLHLHLTDDEGWRIEIKSYPLLTKVGAYRVNKVGYFGSFSNPGPNEPRNYGGFYTQDDIRDLVAYAQSQFVNILPEIDVPGHSLAAVAAYPELSCTPGADSYHVRSGEKIMDWSSKGITALVDNTLCPANDKVYDFLDKVLTEVAGLFPFGYIHMGGDECAKNFWEQSDAVKALMAREGLKDQLEVQSYFEKRLEKIVESKGKKFMGWDEILEGGLAPDAIVMSWRGMQGGIKAAKMHHEVVMSPTNFVYLDYMNGDRIVEPHVYSTLRLNRTYEFDPLPDSVEAKYIIGGQANLWTEQVYNLRHAEYMTWPRAFAVSEDLWTPKALKNWNNFFSRVEKHFDRFNIAQIKYAPSVYDPYFSASFTPDHDLKIDMGTEVQGLDIHYSFDNSFPDQFYPIYSGSLIAPKDAVMLKVITYRGNKPVGRMISMPIDELNSRANRVPPRDN